MTDPVTDTHSDLKVLQELSETIRRRRGESAGISYTAKLLHGGVSECVKKFGEEAIETVIAAVDGDTDHLAEESADLLYHWLVVLEAAGVSLADVMAVLRARQGTGGLVEKAARTKK